MPKQLYNVAIDEPYLDHCSDHHDRDDVYLVWLSAADITEMVERTEGRVSWWEAGVFENLDEFVATWRVAEP